MYKTLTEFNIRFYECDYYGYTNNAVYIHFMDAAITHFLKTCIGRKAFDFTMHIVNVKADFKSTSTFGDTIVVETHIEKIGNTSVTFGQKIFHKVSRDILVLGSKTGVFLHMKTGKKTKVADKLVKLSKM